jgi:copper chaperone CopZ
MPRTFIWSVALIWAGAACLINASRCRRLHCYFTGPLFVVGGGAVFLSGLGILPIPAYLLAIVIVGGTILALVTEWSRGKYLPTVPEVASDDCCAPQSSNRSGALAVSGSVVAAALSSACCWLPLVLLAFGASAAGVAGFLEQWRVPFVAVAAVLLGSGFYFQYWRRPQCDDRSCPVPSKRLRILNKSMLWVATAFVVAMILFPNYVQHLIGGSDAVASADTPSEGIGLVVPVEGMTCEGCASILTNALGKVAGVWAVDVSYADKRALVTISPDDEAVRAQIVEAVTSAGYKTRLEDIRKHP